MLLEGQSLYTHTVAGFEFTLEIPGAVDLAAFDSDELEDFAEELRALAHKKTKLILDFRLQGRPPFAVPDAVATTVQVLGLFLSVTQIVCVFGSERVLSAASRYLPFEQRPVLREQCGDIEVNLICGNIATADADAIVNASNTRLKLGGGVSGAIRGAVSDPVGLQNAMSRLAPLASDNAVVTSSYGLPNTGKIIHVATASGKPDVVMESLGAIFRVCTERRFRSVAIPALGTGTGGLSMEKCAEFTLCAIKACSATGGQCPSRVDLVLYDGASLACFSEAWRQK